MTLNECRDLMCLAVQNPTEARDTVLFDYEKDLDSNDSLADSVWKLLDDVDAFLSNKKWVKTVKGASILRDMEDMSPVCSNYDFYCGAMSLIKSGIERQLKNFGIILHQVEGNKIVMPPPYNPPTSREISSLKSIDNGKDLAGFLSAAETADVPDVETTLN